jgi:hypothetical protein
MKRMNYIVSAAIILGVLLFATWHTRTSARSQDNLLQLSLAAEREGYALGEMLGLTIELKNVSDQSLEVGKPSIYTGNLQLWISEDGMNFREYKGPRWSMLNAGGNRMKLAAGEILHAKASLLYNHHFPTEHLTELYAAKYRQERIHSEFALMNAGRYWLKAVFKDGKTELESEPLAINIAEPVGLDAAVWEKMKADGAYAYFLQTGEIKHHPDSPENRRFVESLQQLSEEFPNSHFAERISNKLTKYKQHLENLRRLK